MSSGSSSVRKANTPLAVTRPGIVSMRFDVGGGVVIVFQYLSEDFADQDSKASCALRVEMDVVVLRMWCC